MRSHGQRMAERFREHESQWFCFLTTMSNPDVGITVNPEPYHPLLKRPRIVVTCPLGTKVAGIKAAFTRRGWEGPIYEAWWAKNGKALVKVGSLYAD